MTAGRAGVMSKPAAASGSTLTINPSAQAGHIDSSSFVDYTNARAGTGDLLNALPGDPISVGQNYSSSEDGETYTCYEGFIDFSLVSLAGAVSTATLSLGLALDLSGTDFTVQARTRDWGATLTTADWVAGASLSALPLLATLATSGIGATGVYKEFTQNGTALKDAVVAAGAGTLRILLCSSRLANGDAPSGEYVAFNAYNHATLKPKLVVVTS